MTISDLLRSDFFALEREAKGQWLLGLCEECWPKPTDVALLIDEDIYAEDDLMKLDYEGCRYKVTLDIPSIEGVVSFNVQSDLPDDDHNRLKALLYYIHNDAFFDGSPLSARSLAELQRSYRKDAK